MWNLRWRGRSAIQFRLPRHAGIFTDNRESFREDGISSLADKSAYSLVTVSAYEFEYVYFTGSQTSTLLGIKIAHERRQHP